MKEVGFSAPSAPAAKADRALDAFLQVPERPATGRTTLAGLLVLVLGIGGFVTWAASAPLASAAVAPGTIAVDTSRKVVQHLEGGAIAELLVREGEKVQAGQVLLRLDDLEAKALHDLLEDRSIALKAQEARLLAEREDSERLIFPDQLAAMRHRADVAAVLGGQERIFTSGREALQGQVDVLKQRIAGFKAQRAALQSQLTAGRDQLALIEDEMNTVRAMVARGLERKPRLLALQRSAAGLHGQQGDLENRMAQVQEEMAATELEILNARRARVERAALELREIQTQLAEVEERLAEARVKLRRRDVSAPQAGTVLNLQYHTVGGVVPPGGKILDLVPAEDRLIVETRISPADIDVVHAGLPARIALSAYKSRTTPQIDGHVLQVSADALSDERTGQPYFTARIAVDEEELAQLEGVRLAPGMPAEAFIETGERTLLDYLVQPIADSFRRAFRED